MKIKHFRRVLVLILLALCLPVPANTAFAESAEALYDLALTYYHGDGVKRDDAKALELLEQAAALGSADAAIKIGDYYCFGRSSFDVVKKDHLPYHEWYMKALFLYKAAAETGDPEAMYRIGMMYENGDGVERDTNTAMVWYQKAAGLGSPEAMRRIGQLYESEARCGLDYKEKELRKALKWYRKAAEAGDKNALFRIGEFYEYGHIVEKDSEQAMLWYFMAADAGDPEACNHLGGLYWFGQKLLNKDLYLAEKWYRKAAEAGDPKAMWNLGRMFFLDDGPGQDYDLAVDWLQKAYDHYEAFDYYSSAIWCDLRSAKAYARAFHFLFNEPEKDPCLAFSQFFEIVDQSIWYSEEAEYWLGCMYDNGIGVQQNRQKALEWLIIAAKDGNSSAMHRIGLMYRDGDGVRRDLEKAESWLIRAVQHGSEESLSALTELFHLTPAVSD